MRIWLVITLLSLLVINFSLSVQATLTITFPATTTLTGKTTLTSSQTTTSTISGVEVIDDGTAGWEATMTSTHFTTIGTVYTIAGSNSTVGTSGTYDGTFGVGDPVARYTVTITTGGIVGTALFDWSTTGSGGGSGTGVTTAASVVLEKGISVTFDATTYVVNDEWAFGVDVFPYTGLYVTPSDITIVSGDTGVSKGTAGYLTGASATSDAFTIMTGAVGDSTGTYQQDEGLSLTIHANNISGTYSATATFTVL